MKKLILLLALNSVFIQLMNAQCPPPQFPPDPPGQDCVASLVLCDDINGYCNTLPSINNQQAFPDCGGNVLNNPSWFSFVAATSGTIGLEIIPSNCQMTGGQSGMQGAIYEGSCTGSAIATQCNCTTGNFILSGPVTAGQSYFIVLDGCAGDVCDYEVNVTSGSTAAVPPPTEIPIGPDMVCPGQLINYFININNAGNYEWSISNPAVAEFNTPPLWVGSDIDVNIIGEGTFDLCVVGTNVCGLNSGLGCLTITSEIPPPVNDLAEGCVGDLVFCLLAPNAPGQIVEPTSQTYVSQEIDPNGCEYNVFCEVSPIILAPVNLGQVELCGPGQYELCPGNFKTETGFYIEECQDPATGCFQEFTLDLAIFEPMANISQPIPELECDPTSTVMLNGSGSTLISFAIGADPTGIMWTGPGIVGSNNDPVIVVNEPGEYCLTITFSRNGTSCSDTECVMVTQNSDVPNPPTLAGEDMPCEGTTYTYTVTAVGTPAPTGYTWTTPGSHPFTTINPSTIEIDWAGSPGGQLCVVASNDCGDSDPATCITIVVGEGPDVPVVSGPDEVCAINQTETYTITNPQANATYNWTVPPGASFNGSGTSITVNFVGTTAGPGQVCATATNDCGTSTPGCVDLTILTTPVTPDLAGPNSVCSNSTGYNYSVSNGGANDTYNWTVPTGATVIGSGATVEVNFNGAQSGSVCVSLTNECGNSQQTCLFVTVIQAPTATISGMGELCEGEMENINLTITATGTPPWDVTYTVNSANPTMVNIPSSPFTLTVNQPGVYELTNLNSNGGCIGTVNGSATIVENPLPTATLSGTDGICENSTEIGQLNIDLTGEAPWTIGWESNGTAQANVVANATPFILNVSESQAGTIMLTSVVDNNGCVGTVSGTGTVNIIQAPTVTSVERVCDPTNTEYTVTIIIQGGDPATYSVAPGNGNLAGNTFVSNPIFSGLGYSFTISDANDCNPVLVEGTFECDCESRAGTMDQTAIETCGNGPIDGIYDPNGGLGENIDGDDVLWFMLHSGNGTSVVAPIVGQYNSPTNITFDPLTMVYGTTYYLSAVVGNNDGTGAVDLTDPCLSVSFGTPVTFFRIPEATISGTDAVCEGDDGALTVNFTGTAPWSVSYDDGTGNIQTITGINSNPYDLVVIPPNAGANSICLTGMSDSNCPGTANGCADIQVNTGVVVDDSSVDCNLTATGFTVTITISGGDPNSYVVTGMTGTLTGNVFTSDEVTTGVGVGFSAVVTDGNDCDPQTVSQTEVVCNCESDAGVMGTMAETACGDGPITVPAADMTNFDGDDVLVYYLHEGTGNTLTNVLNTSDQPSFSFDPATMAYGTTYYVSSVVGNTDGAGGVDPNDPCRSISVGTPIIFNVIPTAAITGGTEICPGDAADLMVELTGSAPWSVTINGDVYDNISGSPFILPVTPDVTTTYQLTAVADNNCDNTVADEQVVSVHEPPTVSLDSEDCNLTGTEYTVCFTISGGDNSCYVVTPNTGTLTGNQFCSDPIPDGGGYSFSVSDCHDCPPVVISNPAHDCACPTQAGDMDPMPLSICQNEMTPASIDPDFNGTQVLDPDDIVCFALYNGAVSLATNPDEPVFGFNPGNMVLGTVYQICPIAGNDDGSGCVDFNDPCFSIGGCVDVSFTALPTATLSGVVDICLGEDPNLMVELTGTGPWVLTYQNTAMDVFTETATASPYTLDVIPDASTIISLTNVVDANGCANPISANSATVNLNTPPIIIGNDPDVVCNALETEFTVSFEISGGDPSSYTVSPGGTLVGNVFTSDPMVSPSAYTFLLNDGNDCGPTVIDGQHVCDCLTEVGIMDNSTNIILCDGESTSASIYNAATEIIAPGEIRIFVLLNSIPVYNAANVVAVNLTEPVFSSTLMNPGFTYFIVAVAGTDDGTGLVDPNGFCFDESEFIQVNVFNLPTVSVSAPDAICQGDTPTFDFDLTGSGPFTINYLINGVSGPPIIIQNNGTQPFPSPVPIPVTSTITLLSVEDANCSNTANQSVTITVNPMVQAGTPLAPLVFCEGVNQTIDLFSQLSGADPSGGWMTSTGQVIQGGTINVGTLPIGVNTLIYTVQGAAPCPDDQAEVIIEITESPVADAGPDQSLNCDITEVTLGIGNTTPGAQISWSGSGISNPSSPDQVIINPGIYTLTVAVGTCIDMDEVEVTLNVSTPDPTFMVNPVSCFGETDGFVIIESVTGGEPTYLFSLDGGPFVAQQSFLNLAPGDHTLVVEDALGCSTTEDFIVEEPVEVTVLLDGNFAVDNTDHIIELGESVVLTAFTTPGPSVIDTFIWSPAGIDSACVGCPTITVTPTQQTAYSVIVDNNGCRAEDQLTIFISKDRPVFVPNAFSPNEDKRNDHIHVYGGPSVATVKSFVIFNRWGEMVHSRYDFEPAPRDYNEELDWDGKHRGEFLNPGVFVWFAEIEFTDGSTGMYQGDISLIRNN